MIQPDEGRTHFVVEVYGEDHETESYVSLLALDNVRELDVGALEDALKKAFTEYDDVEIWIHQTGSPDEEESDG